MAKKLKTSSPPFGSSKMIKCTVTCGEAASPSPRCSNYPVQRVLLEKEVAGSSSPKREAALQLQKVYKSFRTRRKLADCAVLAEQRWWKLLDFAVLKRSSISFYDISKQETAISRWSRARTRAAKVGKGLLKDKKARKLALQHWLEAIDPRHRYGHNLHFYYDCWLSCDCRQPFFYWLDVGDGRDCELYECPRSKLQQQCIKYLGPKEREAYEVIVEDGKFLYKQSRQFLDTSEATKDTKWIFVLSTLKKLYVGQKKKGTFQHSSFLAGGATSAAGRLEVTHGILQAIWPHSGHYKPTEENFQELIHFLEENNVNLANVENSPIDAEEAALIKQSSCKISGLKRDSSEPDLVGKATEFAHNELITEANKTQQQCSIRRQNVTILIPDNTSFLEKLKNESEQHNELFSPCTSPIAPSPGIDHKSAQRATPCKGYMSPKCSLFEQDQEQKTVSEESIVQRIMSKKGINCYQLGKQLSSKWTTGAGPRIGCVRDYPMELQSHVLERMNLSPKSSGQPRVCSSPQNSSLGHSSGNDRSMVYTSPRCLNPISLSLPFERSNSFPNSYSIQC